MGRRVAKSSSWSAWCWRCCTIPIWSAWLATALKEMRSYWFTSTCHRGAWSNTYMVCFLSLCFYRWIINSRWIGMQALYRATGWRNGCFFAHKYYFFDLMNLKYNFYMASLIWYTFFYYLKKSYLRKEFLHTIAYDGFSKTTICMCLIGCCEPSEGCKQFLWTQPVLAYLWNWCEFRHGHFAFCDAIFLWLISRHVTSLPLLCWKIKS